MKKTRKELVEFLSGHICGDITINDVVHELIESGFVEVEQEPFQITYCKNCNENVTGKIHNSTCELTILREVDQCQKFEKMWKEFKRRLIEAKPGVKYFEEAYELMKELEKGE